MKLKLRLLLFEKCNRKCPGCCNKQWNLFTIPIEDDYRHYRKIILTGGEPMLEPDTVIAKIKEIKKVNDCPVIVYTAKIDDIDKTLEVLRYADGMTLTLHEPNDYNHLVELNMILENNIEFNSKSLSLRLNVFKEAGYVHQEGYPLWDIKNNIEWIDNCPLPEDEVFCRV